VLVISDGNMQAYLGSTLSAGDVISFFSLVLSFVSVSVLGKKIIK